VKHPRSLRRAALAAAATMLVGACGSAHPGAAAVLDGYRIPMRTVDEQAAALCAVGLAVLTGGPEGQVVEGQSFRRSVAVRQIQLRMAELAAEELDIEVPDKEVDIEDLGIPTEDLEEADTDALLDFYADNTRLTDLFSAVSLRLAEDSSVQQGQEQALEFVLGQVDDVSIDPRLGLTADLEETAVSGSVSVPVSEGAQPPSPEDTAGLQAFVSELPPQLTCD